MEKKKIILKIIQLKMEIEIRKYYTIGRIRNSLNPIFILNDSDKKVVLQSAYKMFIEYENNNQLNLITDDKLPTNAFKEYIKYRNLKYNY